VKPFGNSEKPSTISAQGFARNQLLGFFKH
jgi:hypothetical protein